jgi:hypothetical protein
MLAVPAVRDVVRATTEDECAAFDDRYLSRAATALCDFVIENAALPPRAAKTAASARERISRRPSTQ